MSACAARQHQPRKGKKSITAFHGSMDDRDPKQAMLKRVMVKKPHICP
jgi:hypothetical protein